MSQNGTQKRILRSRSSRSKPTVGGSRNLHQKKRGRRRRNLNFPGLDALHQATLLSISIEQTNNKQSVAPGCVDYMPPWLLSDESPNELGIPEAEAGAALVQHQQLHHQQHTENAEVNDNLNACSLECPPTSTKGQVLIDPNGVGLKRVKVRLARHSGLKVPTAKNMSTLKKGAIDNAKGIPNSKLHPLAAPTPNTTREENAVLYVGAGLTNEAVCNAREFQKAPLPSGGIQHHQEQLQQGAQHAQEQSQLEQPTASTKRVFDGRSELTINGNPEGNKLARRNSVASTGSWVAKGVEGRRKSDCGVRKVKIPGLNALHHATLLSTSIEQMTQRNAVAQSCVDYMPPWLLSDESPNELGIPEAEAGAALVQHQHQEHQKPHQQHTENAEVDYNLNAGIQPMEYAEPASTTETIGETSHSCRNQDQLEDLPCSTSTISYPMQQLASSHPTQVLRCRHLQEQLNQELASNNASRMPLSTETIDFFNNKMGLTQSISHQNIINGVINKSLVGAPTGAKQETNVEPNNQHKDQVLIDPNGVGLKRFKVRLARHSGLKAPTAKNMSTLMEGAIDNHKGIPNSKLHPLAAPTPNATREENAVLYVPMFYAGSGLTNEEVCNAREFQNAPVPRAVLQHHQQQLRQEAQHAQEQSQLQKSTASIKRVFDGGSELTITGNPEDGPKYKYPRTHQRF